MRPHSKTLCGAARCQDGHHQVPHRSGEVELGDQDGAGSARRRFVH